jgi:Rrf2 family protein
MLRISRRADYAVRTMIAVAGRPYGEHIPSPRIGHQMMIPQSFLVKVVGDLKRGGLLETTAGRGGGLRLARPSERITLRHIVEAVEGPIQIMPCLVRPQDCPRGDRCPAHSAWQRIQDSLCSQLDTIRLVDLSERRTRASVRRMD